LSRGRGAADEGGEESAEEPEDHEPEPAEAVL
jgi:hypothetical protein